MKFSAMLVIADTTVLVPIDLQVGFDDSSQPARWNDAFDDNCRRLLAAWRVAALPILYVRHDSTEPESPLRPDRPGNAFRAGLGPTGAEPVISKTVNSAFIGTPLHEHLKSYDANQIVLFGLTSDMCVSTTARMAANLGWNVVVVGDACDCFELPGANGKIAAKLSHEVHMATLSYEFCHVTSTGQVLEALDGFARGGKIPD